MWVFAQHCVLHFVTIRKFNNLAEDRRRPSVVSTGPRQGLPPVPVLFCAACAMLSVNTGLDPACTIQAHDGTFQYHQLAIADTQIKGSLAHMHDITWAVDDNGQPVTVKDCHRQSWVQSDSRGRSVHDEAVWKWSHTQHHHFTPPPLVLPRLRQTDEIYFSLRNVTLESSWQIARLYFVTIRYNSARVDIQMERLSYDS